MAFDASGRLIVADATRGLISVGSDGSVTVLVDEVDGVQLVRGVAGLIVPTQSTAIGVHDDTAGSNRPAAVSVDEADIVEVRSAGLGNHAGKPAAAAVSREHLAGIGAYGVAPVRVYEVDGIPEGRRRA